MEWSRPGLKGSCVVECGLTDEGRGEACSSMLSSGTETGGGEKRMAFEE